EEVAAAVRGTAASEIVLDVGYEPERRDFALLAKRLGEVNADIVLGISFLDDSVAIVRALKQEGVKPKMLAFTVGPGLHEFGDQLGADAEGVVGIVQWLRSVREPGAQDFAYRFRKRYGYDPGIYAVMGYSAGEILEAAVRLAQSTDRAAVREQLGTMYFKALVGKYNVSETGRQEGRKNYVLQWQDGQRKLVAPADVAERELRY
ncbi:MAG: branched-chain amino acid transport system substrate-binding protein, partial [Bacteroidia bacterium]